MFSYEERLRTEANAENPESDRGSQMSMVSAGVSGSTSTGSTSGYGSVDTNNTHHARQDRVEFGFVNNNMFDSSLPQIKWQMSVVPTYLDLL